MSRLQFSVDVYEDKLSVCVGGNDLTMFADDIAFSTLGESECL